MLSLRAAPSTGSPIPAILVQAGQALRSIPLVCEEIASANYASQ